MRAVLGSPRAAAPTEHIRIPMSAESWWTVLVFCSWSLSDMTRFSHRICACAAAASMVMDFPITDAAPHCSRGRVTSLAAACANAIVHSPMRALSGVVMKTPRPTLAWLRYTSFFVLAPFGVLGETMCLVTGWQQLVRAPGSAAGADGGLTDGGCGQLDASPATAWLPAESRAGLLAAVLLLYAGGVGVMGRALWRARRAHLGSRADAGAAAATAAAAAAVSGEAAGKRKDT